MQKVAIAVYNPSNPIEKAFQDEYHRHAHRWLTAGELKMIMRCFPLYRALRNKVIRNPRAVAELVFGERNDSGSWYYPCDIIELRSILSSKSITWHAPILMFSPQTAKKLMAEYPVCLVFDRNVAKDGTTLRGVHIRPSNRLGLADRLKRVMIRDYLNTHQMDTIYKIIKDTYGHVPSFLMTDLHGISYEKVAGTVAQKMRSEDEVLNWYGHEKFAAGPNDTFDRPFSVGRLPSKNDDPDIMRLPYRLPHEALSFREGDRVTFRYSDLAISFAGMTRHVPITKSLAQMPIMATVKKVDESGFVLLVDGMEKPQTVPLESYIFFSKVR